MATVLQPTRILVTRPSPFGERLCTQLLSSGYHPIFLPTMTISPLAIDSTVLNLADLYGYNWAIFVSQFAVQYGVKVLQTYCNLQQIQLAAIGEKTAAALRSINYTNIRYPAIWNSEGLLALEDFHNIFSQKIAIFCGQNSNKLLPERLRSRGAVVTLLPVYQSALPQLNMQPYQDMLINNLINAVICTSVQSLYNLQQLFGSSLLKHVPLLVSSLRIMLAAKEQGFVRCILIDNADFASVLNGLTKI